MPNTTPTPAALTPEMALRHIATELTALAFQQPDGSTVGPKLMGLVSQIDDTRVALCTCVQPWKDSPQPHAAHCALLNPPLLARLQAENAAAVRAAAIREAADAVDALIPALQREWPNEPANSPWCCGVKDAAAELRRLAAAPTTTPAPEEH